MCVVVCVCVGGGAHNILEGLAMGGGGTTGHAGIWMCGADRWTHCVCGGGGVECCGRTGCYKEG